MPSTLGVSESQLLEFAKSIQLEASKALEGLHASRRGGEGLEFHSSNQYTEGDDARFIDWATGPFEVDPREHVPSKYEPARCRNVHVYYSVVHVLPGARFL